MDNLRSELGSGRDHVLLEGLSVPRATDRLAYRLIKRLIDILGSIILLVIASPVFVLVSIVVKLDSRGPIVFKQTRLGLGGREFTFYKFRSMCIEAEESRDNIIHLNEAQGPIFKIRNDPRVTRIGRWLRRYSVDELPQLFNVLLGDMSFVGPRPPLPCEVEKYETWQLRRLSIVPGITCLWQVSGRSKLSFEDWVRLDLEYIDKRTLWLDVSILLRTIPAVLSGDGAY